MSFPSTQADQESSKLQSHLKLFNMIYKIYILFYYVDISSAMSGTVYQLIFKNVRKIPISIWFPFDFTATNRIFIHTLIWGFWTISNACVNVIAADFFIFAIVFVLALEFEIVGENLKNAINENKISNMWKFVDKHQELIDINEDIKSLFSIIFFYTFLQAAVSISSCGFLLFTAPNIADLIFSIAYTACSLSQVFLYCFFGEKLISSSQNVGNNILNSNWYDLEDVGIKKSLILIVMRSQKACVLSGFGFVSLTIETFSNVRF
jgi:gustatory receptor